MYTLMGKVFSRVFVTDEMNLLTVKIFFVYFNSGGSVPQRHAGCRFPLECTRKSILFL